MRQRRIRGPGLDQLVGPRRRVPDGAFTRDLAAAVLARCRAGPSRLGTGACASGTAGTCRSGHQAGGARDRPQGPDSGASASPGEPAHPPPYDSHLHKPGDGRYLRAPCCRVGPAAGHTRAVGAAMADSRCRRGAYRRAQGIGSAGALAEARLRPVAISGAVPSDPFDGIPEPRSGRGMLGSRAQGEAGPGPRTSDSGCLSVAPLHSGRRQHPRSGFQMGSRGRARPLHSGVPGQGRQPVGGPLRPQHEKGHQQ